MRELMECECAKSHNFPDRRISPLGPTDKQDITEIGSEFNQEFGCVRWRGSNLPRRIKPRRLRGEDPIPLLHLASANLQD